MLAIGGLALIILTAKAKADKKTTEEPTGKVFVPGGSTGEWHGTSGSW
jgi:hypothetical protein